MATAIDFQMFVANAVVVAKKVAVNAVEVVKRIVMAVVTVPQTAGAILAVVITVNPDVKNVAAETAIFAETIDAILAVEVAKRVVTAVVTVPQTADEILEEMIGANLVEKIVLVVATTRTQEFQVAVLIETSDVVDAASVAMIGAKTTAVDVTSVAMIGEEATANEIVVVTVSQTTAEIRGVAAVVLVAMFVAKTIAVDVALAAMANEMVVVTGLQTAVGIRKATKDVKTVVIAQHQHPVATVLLVALIFNVHQKQLLVVDEKENLAQKTNVLDDKNLDTKKTRDFSRVFLFC